MQARYYDPVIGRFYSNDPVGAVSHLSNEEGIKGFNRYSYAVNNPYKYTDPDGRCITGVLTVPCAIGIGKLGSMVYKAYKTYRLGAVTAGVATAVVLNESSGASDAEPTPAPEGGLDGWIYGPEDDPKINDDGSTKPNTWTTPDDYGSQEEAQDKLDPFKPMTGKRPVHIPGGTPIQTGTTPGREGPFNGSGGANEVLVPEGLPPGSTGEWEKID